MYSDDYELYYHFFNVIPTEQEVTECGIFHGGARPDCLMEHPDWLMEIKTRSVNSTGPLTTLEKYMLLQVQIQMY